MASNNWKKIENEAGYPLFIDDATGKQHYDHPEFVKIIQSIEEFNGIKYNAYRTAFKVFALQSHLKVPPLRICSGVFARHQLSLSETSLSLDTAELEAVLGDIYFAAEKDGYFNGDVDLVVDLLINLLLNVFDKDRKEPVRVLAAKTLLICLSEESISDKWAALANCSADHNGCVSPKRLASLLTHVAAVAQFLGATGDAIQSDVDVCFSKSAGMLGVTSRTVAEWGAAECKSTQWLSVAHRVVVSRQTTTDNCDSCSCCASPLVQVLKFQCTKCSEVYFCEKCYLYDKNLTQVSGHKKNHPIHEIVDGQPKAPVCLSFIKGMKRFFFCTKTKKRKTSIPTKARPDKDAAPTRRRKDGKPAIFTSTVGKASGHKDNPAIMLQDIINQLEAQNKVLQDLASQFDEVAKSNDAGLMAKVDAHWTQVSTQINRLKILKDNLTASQVNLPSETTTDKSNHRQAFDLFSPIPIIADKQSKINDNNKNQPRVLSLDSGNFSVVSKNASQNLLTVSGEKPAAVHFTADSISAVSVNDISSWYNGSKKNTKPRVLSLDSGNFSVVSKNASQNLLTVSGEKPAAVHFTADSISAVSVNDISSWYNEPDTQNSDRRIPPTRAKPPDIAACEQKYAADNLSVETSNDKMKELNADLDTVLDRLHQILANNFAMDAKPPDIATCEQKYAADNLSVETSNDKMKELNADLDTVLDRLHQILANNFAMDESCFDNTQLRETANEMEGLLGTLIRGVEQRATLNATKGLV